MSAGEPGPDEAEATRLQRLAAMAGRIDLAAGRVLLFVSEHWLAMVNIIVGLYALLPFVSPLLYHAGLDGAGKAIQVIYMPFCHQLPERSYFLFGEQPVYTPAELEAYAGPQGLSARFVGNEQLGYKVAYCERDVAIYTAMLIAGLLFTGVRRRLKPLSFWVMAGFSAPMAVDGFGQLLGLWTSSWISRSVTGALFGVGIVLLIYPYASEGMADAYRQAQRLVESEQQP